MTDMEMRQQMIQLFACGMKYGRAIIEGDIDGEDIFNDIFENPKGDPATPEEIMKKTMSFPTNFSLIKERKECGKSSYKMCAMENFVGSVETFATNLNCALDRLNR